MTATHIDGEVIIGAHAGGFGDTILHAELMRACQRAGMVVRYAADQDFRNSEISKLLIEDCSAFTAWSGEAPTAGLRSGIGGIKDRVKAYGQWARSMENPILGICAMHNLSEGYGDWLLPVIDYEPRIRPDLKNVVLADPTSTSQPISALVFHDFVDYVARDYLWDRGDVKVLAPPHRGPHGRDSLSDARRIEVANIWEWIDAIASCSIFLSTEAGGNSAAAAVRAHRGRPTYVIQSVMASNEELFVWPGIRYKTTGQMGPDFHAEGYL